MPFARSVANGPVTVLIGTTLCARGTVRICLTYASARLAEPGKADRTAPQASCRTFKNQGKIECPQREIFIYFVFKSLEGPKRTLRFGGTPVAKSSIFRFGVEIVSEIKAPPKPHKNFGRGASGQ